MVNRSDNLRGFLGLSRLWEVERTFGWLMSQRYQVHDYETTTTSAKDWSYFRIIRR